MKGIVVAHLAAIAKTHDGRPVGSFFAEEREVFIVDLLIRHDMHEYINPGPHHRLLIR